MQYSKISPKYQIVIPKEVRKSLQLKPGQRVQIIVFGSRIEVIPERDIAEMRGFLRGMSTEFGPEGERP